MPVQPVKPKCTLESHLEFVMREQDYFLKWGQKQCMKCTRLIKAYPSFFTRGIVNWIVFTGEKIRHYARFRKAS